MASGQSSESRFEGIFDAWFGAPIIHIHISPLYVFLTESPGGKSWYD